MAQRSFRKSQLIAFDNVAAGQYVNPIPNPLALLSALTDGSEGVLSDPSGLIVVKPCKKEEIIFYESTASHPEFATYIPTYIGTLALSSEPSKALPSVALISPDVLNHQAPCQPQVVDAVAVEKAWAPSNGGKITTDLAIVLENVAARFKKPNILDVKLGARLWADDAPAAKRERLDKVAAETTSKSLGLRIAGMRTWQGLDAIGQKGVALDGYKLYEKDYGKTFKPDTVGQGFEEYFCLSRVRSNNRNTRKVIRRFIEDLKAMQDVLEKEESRMYSSSLLFVYEGDDLALEAAFKKEKQILDSIANGSMTAQASTNGDSVTPHENGIHHPDGAPENVALPTHQAPLFHAPTNGNATEPPEDEGDEEDDEDCPFPPIQTLKLIDFAHAEYTPGHGPDENLLHGIRNVINILNDIQAQIQL